MKQIFTLLALLNFILAPSIAQKTQLSLDDVVNGGANYNSFKPERMERLQWADDSHFSYIKNDTLLVLQSVNGKEKTILSLNEFKTIAFEYQGSNFPYYQWHDGKTIEFNLSGEKLFYNTNKKISWHITYPKNARNIDLSFANMEIAYTIENNLYIATIDNKKASITSNTDKGIVCGQTVHRNEFGINKGTFWSPNGNYLAFYRKDETMVGDYPLVNINARQATVENIKYPMAGMRSHHVTIGVYNFKTEKTTFLETGLPKEHYLTNIAWSPDEKTIYLAEVNRGQDTMHLNSYDAESGKFIKTLFTETDKEYIEPQSPMTFLPNNAEQFIWTSRRDGYNHLYLYNIDGTLTKQITKGPWEVTNILGFDKKKQHIFISATKKSHLQRHTYKVAIDDDKNEIKRITENDGVHKSLLSADGDFILDTWSNVQVPLVTDLISTKNQSMKNLFTASNPYTDYKLGKMKLFSIASSDSSLDLSCRMILPPSFDRAKKYPAIIYVYGGPHSQLINESWNGNVQMWQYYMAQKGYIMFTLDNRGTSFRGADFEQIIHRELGKHEMEDQMKGYDYLTSQPYIDKDRIGVFGWSFGGFMTTSLMTHYPEAFNVGVAGGPVIDWSNYEIMYGERYMDTPAENPKGYKNSNLTNNAKDLQGRLLMIHGGQDPVVVWQHSQKFARECVKENIPLDYFVYPTHQHNVRGKDRVHLMGKISQYFDDFL